MIFAFFAAALLNAFFTMLTYEAATDSLEIYPPTASVGLMKPMKRSVVWKYFVKDAVNKKARYVQ